MDRRLATGGLTGILAGVAAWVSGYALMYVLVSPQIRDSALHRAIEAFGGEPATYEMVGWVFFNAHFVNTVFRDLPILGSHSTTYIGAEDGFSIGLYAIPILILILCGAGLAWYHDTDDPTYGALTGALVVPGYLAASIVGAMLFEVAIAGARGAPDFLPAIFLAGILYPVIFGGLGGLLGDRYTREARSDEWSIARKS